jgi:hypothetical protein
MIWKFPDENAFNQIDYFIINARHLSNLMDVRTYRGTNVDFDCYLVISNTEAKSSMQGKRGSHVRKFNSERLKDPEVEARYVERIYESLTESIDSESVNGVWKTLKEIIMMSADITLGKIGRVEHNYWQWHV